MLSKQDPMPAPTSLRFCRVSEEKVADLNSVIGIELINRRLPCYAEERLLLLTFNEDMYQAAWVSKLPTPFQNCFPEPMIETVI